MPAVTVFVGIVPVVAIQIVQEPVTGSVWGLLFITGMFQALYQTGLTFAYQTGDFTMVYPVARALPVLALALVDVLRGRAPTPLAWLGMVMVFLGCALMPHTSLRTLRWNAYRHRALFWVLVIAFSTVGYSTVDKVAAEQMSPGPLSAACYYFWQMAFAALPLALLIRLRAKSDGKHRLSSALRRRAYAQKRSVWIEGLRSEWLWPAVVGIGMFASYWLILWAYQVSLRVSYVVALRQFSIVFGVVLGAIIFREPAPGLRIVTACVIVVGMICIAFSG